MSTGGAPQGGREEQKLSLDGLPPLTFEQKWKWALILVMSLISCIASKVPQPVQIYIDQSYFNHMDPCVTKAQAKTEGCHEALTLLTFYGGWFQSAHGFLAFYMSPIMGRLSDAYGRKRVWIWCGILDLIPATIMFLAQTPVLEHGPWWWLRSIFGVMSFSGGVGGAYIGDLLPKEWRAIAFALGTAVWKVGDLCAPLIDLIHFKSGMYFCEPRPDHVCCSATCDCTHRCNCKRGASLCQCCGCADPYFLSMMLKGVCLLLAIFVMQETLQEKNRTPVSWKIANPFDNLKILWNGPENITGYRSTTLFRRLAFCLCVQIMCFDGSGVTIGNYIKNEFAPSKEQSVIQTEIREACSLLTLVVLYRPLIGWVGERGCVVVGMGVNCLYLSSFLLLVHNMNTVYITIGFAQLGSVAWPAISAIKSTKCSQKDQGRVMGALSGITSLAWAIAPLIFNNLYAATTDVHDIAREERWWHGWHLPVGIVWGLMILCSMISLGVSLTVPDPRVIWIAVPDDNSSTGMTLLGDSRDKVDDWKVATPTRGVMGDDGFIEEAPYELIDYEDDPGWQQKKGWYRAPLGARLCDRMCFKQSLVAKEVDVWWASKDAAALRPRRRAHAGKRFTQELAELNRKRAARRATGERHVPHTFEGLLNAGITMGPNADYRF